MPDSIDQKLRLAARNVTRLHAAQKPDAAQGIVVFKRPKAESATFNVKGTADTITIRLYVEDNKKTPRHRIKMAWTDSRDGGSTLHDAALRFDYPVSDTPLGQLSPRRQAKALLDYAGIEVD